MDEPAATLTPPNSALSACGDCKFFVANDPTAQPPPIASTGDGRCHRYPPRIEIKDATTTLPNLVGVWPPVAKEGFRSGCGEWQALKPSPPVATKLARRAKGRRR